MESDTATLNHRWATEVVRELVNCGITQFFLSPGSRCTPLTIAVAQHPNAHAILHVDERASAFAAVGYGRGRMQAAALICTSGTAAANYLPAIIEADSSDVPLIVLTADRPPELQHSGANQTIDQTRLYGAFVRWHHSMPCPTSVIGVETVVTTIDQATHQAHRMPAGPVHLNIPFREPFTDDSTPDHQCEYTISKPRTTYVQPAVKIDTAAFEHLASPLSDATRGVIIVGTLKSVRDRDAVAELIDTIDWPCLPDITSGLPTGTTHATTIAYYDLLLATPTIDTWFAPDVVLHIGGPLVSKTLQNSLATATPDHYIRLQDNPRRLDPTHNVTCRIESSIAAGCRALTAIVDRNDASATWLQRFQTIDSVAGTVLKNEFAITDTLSEPAVAATISQLIPADHALFLAASMPVRDMNTFAARDDMPRCVSANRGASGIDGTLASAIGYALGTQRPTTVVIGDLAMLHDLNALALLHQVPNVTVVVINNGGGGIFSFLPIARHPSFSPYFSTPHGYRFGDVSAMFAIPWSAPASMAEFRGAYADAIHQSGNQVIEVQTDRNQNQQDHTQLRQAVAEAVTNHWKMQHHG